MELEKLAGMTLDEVLSSGTHPAEMTTDLWNWLALQVPTDVPENEEEEWGYREMLSILTGNPVVSEDLAMHLLLIGIDGLARQRSTFLRAGGAGNQAEAEEECVTIDARYAPQTRIEAARRRRIRLTENRALGSPALEMQHITDAAQMMPSRGPCCLPTPEQEQS